MIFSVIAKYRFVMVFVVNAVLYQFLNAVLLQYSRGLKIRKKETKHGGALQQNRLKFT